MIDPPYFAVIFTSTLRSGPEAADYEQVSARMVALATDQPGFLGVESARGNDGQGITVSYWASEAAIDRWKRDADHRLAQQRGYADFYQRFTIRVARVERHDEFDAPP